MARLLFLGNTGNVLYGEATSKASLTRGEFSSKHLLFATTESSWNISVVGHRLVSFPCVQACPPRAHSAGADKPEHLLFQSWLFRGVNSVVSSSLGPWTCSWKWLPTSLLLGTPSSGHLSPLTQSSVDSVHLTCEDPHRLPLGNAFYNCLPPQHFAQI